MEKKKNTWDKENSGLRILQTHPFYIDAKRYAIEKHRETNHLYDGKPYEVHLLDVVVQATNYLHLLPSQIVLRLDVLAACWCHDLIEDCRVSYNDLKKETNEQVAELCFAVTNEKGRTRKERAGAKYYDGILDTPFAPFVKLCDRLANVSYAVRGENQRMLGVYRSEQPEFKNYLLPTVEEYKPMWDELDALLNL